MAEGDIIDAMIAEISPSEFVEQVRKNEIGIVKLLRVEIDRNIQTLRANAPSRERSLALTKLQEAVMWLGMDLKRLGTENPYPNSYNPDNTVVDPTADGLKL